MGDHMMDSIRSILVVVIVVALSHSSLSVKDSNSKLRGGNEMLRENEDIPSDFLPDFSKELTAEERDEKELDQDEPGSDEDSGIKEDRFEETLDEVVQAEKQDETSNEKENSSVLNRERNGHDAVEQQSNENDILGDVDNSIEMKNEAQKEESMDEEPSKENKISEDDVADNETMENVETDEENPIENDSDDNTPTPTPPTLDKRRKGRLTKNEMINRVRKYALKHGISIKEFRKTVMDFKEISKAAGEEFHPKHIFKFIKDKIQQMKRERKSLDAASSIAASSQEITGKLSQQIFKRAKLERQPLDVTSSIAASSNEIAEQRSQQRLKSAILQPLDATSSIAASSQEIAEQRSQQRFKKMGKPGFRIPKRPMKRPKHPNCMKDENCKRVLKSEDARCGPLRRCYIAKPCNSESDCSPNYECLSPSQIRAKKLRELRMNQIFKRQRNRLARRQRSRNLRQNGGKAARFGGMQTGVRTGRKIRRNSRQRNLPLFKRPSMIGRPNRVKREATDEEKEIDEKNDSELIGDLDDDEDELGLDMKAPLEKEDLESAPEDEDGNDDGNDEKLFDEAMDEAGSGGISDKSLNDERSEQQGGLTDSVSTSDEGKKSTNTAEAKDRSTEGNKIPSTMHPPLQPGQTLEQKVCVLKRPSMPMPIKPLPPALLPPHRRRATLRKGRGLQQVQSAMGSPQVQLAPRRRKNNKKGRGKCFNGIIKRLLKSDLTGEEFEQAKLLLAKIFPGKGIVRALKNLARNEVQNFPERQSPNIPTNESFNEDSGPVLDALPDFSTPERNSRKELEARNDWTENNDSLELTRKRMEERW